MFSDDGQYSQLLRGGIENRRHRAHLQPASVDVQSHAIDIGRRFRYGTAHGRLSRHIRWTLEKGIAFGIGAVANKSLFLSLVRGFNVNATNCAWPTHTHTQWGDVIRLRVSFLCG